MAGYTKFTLSPNGQLVYKKTGRLAPSGYTFRKGTVYGLNGRKIGTLSRKLTRTEAAKIAKAEKSRNARLSRASKGSKGRTGKPRTPSKTATQRYGEGWDEFDSEEFPDASASVKNEFAQRVREAAASVAPPALQMKIRRLTTDALWEAYRQDQYIFEVYFKYHQPWDAPHTSDISVWLYQFVNRVEQFMGVV